MTNMGMQRFIESLGLKLVRTPVGDHHVEKAMRDGGYNLGGECSGHIILRDHATTGDGTLAALQVLAFLRESGKKASDLRGLYEAWPLILKNVHLEEGQDAAETLARPDVVDAVKAVEKTLGDTGRVIVRKSGTEPLIRVMVEAEEHEDAKAGVEAIVAAIVG